MSQKAEKIDLAIVKFELSGSYLKAEINDGRIVLVPLDWFPRLKQATPQQLQEFEISPYGYGIHWKDLDEDISIRAFIG